MRQRYWLLLAALAVSLTGLVGLRAALPTAQTADPYRLVYAVSPDHARPQPLEGATVSGVIYPFTTPDAGVDDVTFALDGRVVWTEDTAPFDFAGGTETQGNPWDTTRVADGEHTITAELLLLDGARLEITARFTVANSAPPREAATPTMTPTEEDGSASTSYSLVYSSQADHAAPQPLDGATVSGVIYPFTAPEDGVDDVIFALDGQVVWTEDNAPFDFAGGTETQGNPWNSSQVADGEHTIGADLVLESGAVITIAATFIVSNAPAPGEPTPDPTEEATPTSTAGTEEPEPSPTEETATPTDESTPEQPDGSDVYALVYSTSATRSAPTSLGGATLSGTVYVFLSPESGVDEVRFSLDDTVMRTELDVAFDFMGTNGAQAYPWDTTQVADGPHRITAEVLLDDGSLQSVATDFTVSNGTTPPEEPSPDPPPSPGSGGSTEIATGAMLGGGYDPHWFYIRRNGGGWNPTYAGTELEGRLMNFRAANAVFDDENRSDDNPNANTNTFISNFGDYKAHGILAMTVSLQGGHPGYEGALASAFKPDGSLKAAWMDRAGRVIEAADQHGMVIILTYFYQRQDQVLADEAAVRQAVINVTDWLIASNYRNVIIEVANEFGLGYQPDHEFQRWQHEIIFNNTVNGGIGELVNLAKSRFNGKAFRLPVSASKGGIRFDGAIAQTGDIALVHGNGIRDWEGDRDTYGMMRGIYDSSNVPVVMNEDDNGTTPNSTTLARDTHAMDDAISAGGSWGLMWKPYNQLYPFGWSLGNPSNVTSEAGYFHAILDIIQDRAY